MSSVIRIGTVSKVNYEDGTIEVAYSYNDSHWGIVIGQG